MSRGRRQMTERLERGFTVALDNKFKKNVYLGLGKQEQVPPKPFAPPPEIRTLFNDSVRLHEDGRDFLGPFQVRRGEDVGIYVRTTASWGVDCYLVDDVVARRELSTYIDPRSNPGAPQRALAVSNGGTEWKYKWTAPTTSAVWLIVDNSDKGRSAPPSNMRDDVIDLKVFVGVVKK